MATADIQQSLDEVKETVTCSICMELFNQPKVIGPCQHSFCRECLRQYIEKRSNKGCTETDIPCPYCRRSCQLPRDGVDGFMDNIALRDIVETVENLPSSLFSRGQAKPGCCNICKLLKLVDVSAVQYCETCSLYLCSACHGQHTLSPLKAAHTVKPLAGVCKRHKTPLTHYCLNCMKAICLKCAGHCVNGLHGVSNFEETLKSLSDSLQQSVDQYREDEIKQCLDSKIKRLETPIDIAEKAGSTTKDEVRDAVATQVKVVSEEIEKIERKRLECYASMDAIKNEMFPYQERLRELTSVLADLQNENLNIGKQRHEAVKRRTRLKQSGKADIERVDRSYDSHVAAASDERQEVMDSLEKANDILDRARQTLDGEETDGGVVERIERLMDVKTNLTKISEAGQSTATRYQHRLEELPVFNPDSTLPSSDQADGITSRSNDAAGFAVSNIGTTIRPGPDFVHSFRSYERTGPCCRATKTADFEVPDGDEVKRLFLLSGNRVLAVCNSQIKISIFRRIREFFGIPLVCKRSIIFFFLVPVIASLLRSFFSVPIGRTEWHRYRMLSYYLDDYNYMYYDYHDYLDHERERVQFAIKVGGVLCMLCIMLGQWQDVWIWGTWSLSRLFRQKAPSSSLVIHQWLPPYTSVCRTIKHGLESAVDATVNESEHIVLLLWPAPRTGIRIIDLDGVKLRDIEIYDTFCGLKTCFNPIPHPRGIGVYSTTRFLVWGGDKSTSRYQLLVNNAGEVKDRKSFPPEYSVVHDVGIKGSEVYIVWESRFYERNLSVASTDLSPSAEYPSYLLHTDRVSSSYEDLWMLRWGERGDLSTESEMELSKIRDIREDGRRRLKRDDDHVIALNDVFGRPLKRKCSADVKFFVRGNQMVASFPQDNASGRKMLMELFALTN